MKNWSCPECFGRGNDSTPLIFDKKRGEFYCLRCCYTAKTEEDVVGRFKQHQVRYRLMTTRLSIIEDCPPGRICLRQKD